MIWFFLLSNGNILILKKELQNKKEIFTKAKLFREIWQKEIFTGSRPIFFVLCFDDSRDLLLT